MTTNRNYPRMRSHVPADSCCIYRATGTKPVAALGTRKKIWSAKKTSHIRMRGIEQTNIQKALAGTAIAGERLPGHVGEALFNLHLLVNKQLACVCPKEITR
jgi:hypothetical protein